MNWRCKRWHLFLLVLPLVWSACANQAETGQAQSVSASQFKQILDRHFGDPEVVLIDIRTAKEFRGGHIQGAVLLDYHARDFVRRLKTLEREKRYLVYCRSGNRSAKSLAIFNKLNFVHVLHLETGIRGWVQERYPVVR